MTAAQKAQALASDLRYVLRKHKARIVWREELDGRVTVNLEIRAAPAPGAFAAALGPKFPWWLLILANLIVTVVYFIIIKL